MAIDLHTFTTQYMYMYRMRSKATWSRCQKKNKKKKNEVNIVVHCVACTVYATTQRNTPLLGFNAFVWVFLYVYMVWFDCHCIGVVLRKCESFSFSLCEFLSSNKKGKCSMCSNIEKIRQCENRCVAVEWKERKRKINNFIAPTQPSQYNTTNFTRCTLLLSLSLYISELCCDMNAYLKQTLYDMRS